MDDPHRACRVEPPQRRPGDLPERHHGGADRSGLRPRAARAGTAVVVDGVRALDGAAACCWSSRSLYLFYAGIGIWGIDWPVMWGFAILSYVWWIAIASRRHDHLGAVLPDAASTGAPPSTASPNR